jgi:hypothetical protein
MTRASITDAISNTVAENALCWCDGRSARLTRPRNPLLVWELDPDDAMNLRFYTRVRTKQIGQPKSTPLRRLSPEWVV